MGVDDILWGLAAYEVYAAGSGRVPTITKLCRSQPALILPVLAVIALHLWRKAQ